MIIAAPGPSMKLKEKLHQINRCATQTESLHSLVSQSCKSYYLSKTVKVVLLLTNCLTKGPKVKIKISEHILIQQSVCQVYSLYCPSEFRSPNDC